MNSITGGLVVLIGLIIMAGSFYFLIGALLSHTALDGLYNAVMGFGTLAVGWKALTVGIGGAGGQP